MSNIGAFVKNRNFCQKLKLLSKIETFVKIESSQKSKLLSNIETFVKNRNFCQKSKLLSKIETFVNNRNFCQKSKLLSTIETFVKNRKFCQKSKLLSKIETFVKNRNFCQKSIRIYLGCENKITKIILKISDIFFSKSISISKMFLTYYPTSFGISVYLDFKILKISHYIIFVGNFWMVSFFKVPPINCRKSWRWKSWS